MKDNYDTHDLPTTAGSQLLEGSIPPKDAFVVKKLRDAGATKDGLPVTISFFGKDFSEPKLLGYGYDFEQATHARVLPKYTPALWSDIITY